MYITSMTLELFFRIIRLALITLSIITTYYTMIVLQDYVILTNPDGPDTSDYFE
jgi:hypothetical protein